MAGTGSPGGNSNARLLITLLSVAVGASLGLAATWAGDVTSKVDDHTERIVAAEKDGEHTVKAVAEIKTDMRTIRQDAEQVAKAVVEIKADLRAMRKLLEERP